MSLIIYKIGPNNLNITKAKTKNFNIKKIVLELFSNILIRELLRN